jgi:hypothetical protein
MTEKRLSLKVVLKNSKSSSLSNVSSASSSKASSATASTTSSVYSPEEEDLDEYQEEELTLSSEDGRDDEDDSEEMELDFESGVEESTPTPPQSRSQTGRSLNIRLKTPIKKQALEYDEDEEFYEDELRNVDTKRMTARQRAKLEKGPSIPDELTQPPQNSVLGKKRGLTEEEQMKRLEESKRRKDQREQKLEETKMATIQRLLKKQSIRSKKIDNLVNKNNSDKMDKGSFPILKENPNFIYKSGKGGSTLMIKEDFLNQFLLNQTIPPIPKASDIKCRICGAPRTCWHSKLHIPLCQNIICHKKAH